MLTFVRQHEDRLLADLKASERAQLLKLLGKIMLAARSARSSSPPPPKALPKKSASKSANGGVAASPGRRTRAR